MKERLEQWLIANRLDYHFVTDYVFIIKDMGTFVAIEGQDFAIVDETFSLVLSEADAERINAVPEEIAFCVYEFGTRWYYTDSVTSIKLKELRYLGKEKDIKETFQLLGVHGPYDLCNGSRTYSDWCEKAKFCNIEALGLAEENTLAGTLEFQNVCAKKGIKSVIGETVTVRGDKGDYTVKLYVLNTQGWKNLLMINACINVHNEEQVVKEQQLYEYADGLVCVLTPEVKLDQSFAFFDICFHNRLYYQFDIAQWDSLQKDNEWLGGIQHYLLNYRKRLKPIMIADAYYLEKEHATIRKDLNAIGKLAFKNQSSDRYFKTPTQMLIQCLDLFEEKDEDKMAELLYEAIDNVNEVATTCSQFKIDTGKLYLPAYIMTDQEKSTYSDKDEMLWGLIENGIVHRAIDEYNDYDAYVERIEKEMKVICEAKLQDYFLITWDILNWAHSQGIMTGYGRGSAAGCLVSYLLGIVQTDPLKYDLLFERFLNEGRLYKKKKVQGWEVTDDDGEVTEWSEYPKDGDAMGFKIVEKEIEIKVTGSLPDIDNDIAGERREEVKRYVERRYGKDRVAGIGTYSALKIKSALGELARRHGINPGSLAYITGAISKDNLDYAGLFEYALTPVKPVKDFIQNYPELIEKLPLILNQPKTASIHAAGVIIVPESPNGIYDQMPVKKVDGVLVSEWVDDYVEQSGFLKMDLLGLLQLDKFDEIIKFIKQYKDVDIVLENIPLDDPGVYEYFTKGYNEDVFQFGGVGLKGYTRDLEPEVLDDLIATVALYRPGPIEIGSHQDYVKRKNGRQEISYPRGTEKILSNTYGLMCIAENSDVHTLSGHKLIQDVQKNDLVVTEDGSFQRVLEVLDKGVKETIRIRTTFGEELVCTKDHKVLTQLGWIEAGELKKHHLIKGFWYQEEESKAIGNDKDWLLGLFLADGHSPSKGSSPQIACSSKLFAEQVLTLIEKEFPSMQGCFIHSQDNGLGVTWFVEIRQHNRVKQRGEKQKNDFNHFLRENDLYRCVKDQKKWPQRYTYNTIVGFLEGDGCFKNGRVRLKYKDLAYGLYKALQSYRIFSSFFQDKDSAWTVKFTPTAIVTKIRSSERGFSNIYIPRIYIKGLQWTNEFDYRNHFLPSLFKRKPFITIETAMRLGYRLNDQDHAVWGKILSVKKNKSTHVYDLTINKKHSFVVGGLVVHNCYQEQVQKIAEHIAGFTPNEADDVRKAIGKKLPELMAQQKEKFVHGAVNNHYPQREAEELWEQIEVFASYSFNKSHATCYAITGYFCQWFKVHYPLEFWLVALKHASKDQLINRLAEMSLIGGMEVGGPNINYSTNDFTTDGKKIYWSLQSVTQVGERALTDILAEREKGHFFSITEFASRLKGTAVKRNTVINLVLAGAFDDLHRIKDEKSIRMRFSILQEYLNFIDSKIDETIVEMQNWENYQWTLKQREVCGLGMINIKTLLSKVGCEEGNKKTSEGVRNYTYYSIPEILSEKEEHFAKKGPIIGGIITKIEEKRSKKNDKGPFALIEISDGTSTLSGVMWSDQYMINKDALKVNGLLFLKDVWIKYDEKFRRSNTFYVTEATKVATL